MNSKVEQANQAVAPADVAKYVLAVLIAAAGLFAFYWFSQWPGPVRGLVMVVSLAAAVAVAAFTAKGRDAREFISESVFELRKVVWPTRQESLRITGLILIVVVIVSLVLSLFDWVIALVIEQLLKPGSWFNSLFS
ncbi:MAG TPA: preprotein translocase subunit SecE [Arenimonas sp.]|nr:preprotein translocase subunit SecE [Arenimonas sp.]